VQSERAKQAGVQGPSITANRYLRTTKGIIAQVIITRRSQGRITFGETYRLHLHLEYYHPDAVHGGGVAAVHPSC